MHAAITECGEDEVRRGMDARYLLATPEVHHPDYQGVANSSLDMDIEVWEVRVAVHDLNTRSAAGPDRVTNKWKAAKTILILKPGKPPDIGNLRPIYLTSCVGKVLKHVLMNRWQLYPEESGLYPNTVIVFRSQLGTKDAMIQLKSEILDDNTRSRDNRAVLGLDLQSAFDKVTHSAILVQVSRLNMGHTVEIHAGDLQLPEKKLGSVGTPQGSVISPPLFNLVMIGVAERLSRVSAVRHAIYADDITLWVKRGSHAHIEDTLQAAVDAIEEQLDGSGLVCSPSKSELLVVPPKGVKKKEREPRRDREKITIPSR
ncbi:uncharacterized protein LOC119380336 [Rhipicephalus sanguineus]|uniref:uncharacterized protein LOC119380336 n=1 Tax=Rhipicephalus sanguineus TaxID=34632 RepID=UPI001893E315|nr:uncharacterized protein LOC119380336 [Rhipicephalus sanguineus]